MAFGYRNTSSEDLEKEQSRREQENSSKDIHKIKQKHNLFLVMPPMKPTTPLPYKDVQVHYKPFHICERSAPILKWPEDGGEKPVVKSRSNAFSCQRCKFEFEHYRGELAVRDWKNTAEFKEFKAHEGKAKTVFQAIPVDDFFNALMKPSGKRKVWKIETVKNAAEMFAAFQEAYAKHVQTDDFKKALEKNPENLPKVRFEFGGSTHTLGVVSVMFSQYSWFSSVQPEIEDCIRSQGINPWGAENDGTVPFVLDIFRAGTTRDDTTYASHVYDISDSGLKLTDEFMNQVGSILPDITDIYNPPSEEAVEAIVERRRSTLSGSNEGQQSSQDEADKEWDGEAEENASNKDVMADSQYQDSPADALY